MADETIDVGALLFTLIEPHRGHEVAYNRWYERDHFYAGCLIGKWCFSGGRFVSLAEHKDVRYPKEGSIADDVRLGSFLSMYWIQKGHTRRDWVEWGSDQVRWLHENDRMFPDRDHVHTEMYRRVFVVERDEDGVPPHMALERRFPGLVSMIVEAPPTADSEALAEWLRDDHIPALLDGSPVAMCLAGRSFGGIVARDAAETAQQLLLLFFCDEDPLAIWDEVFAGEGDAIAESGLGTVRFASPYIPTVPGTDTYTDRIW